VIFFEEPTAQLSGVKKRKNIRIVKGNTEEEVYSRVKLAEGLIILISGVHATSQKIIIIIITARSFFLIN
jgi:hypothetical protein